MSAVRGPAGASVVAEEASAGRVYTITLREKREVKWAEDTVDNEHLGRKKSKKCCIFHKKRAFGESDSEDDTDDDSDDSTAGHRGCSHGHSHSGKDAGKSGGGGGGAGGDTGSKLRGFPNGLPLGGSKPLSALYPKPTRSEGGGASKHPGPKGLRI